MTHTEPAWAKINLTLDILGKRRADGLPRAADGDAVRGPVGRNLEPAVSGRGRASPLSCDAGLRAAGTADNIAGRAVGGLFRGSCGSPGGGAGGRTSARRVPVCAGMAGGSSDGAAALRAPGAAVRPGPAGRRRLEAIAAQVGSRRALLRPGGDGAWRRAGGRSSPDLPPLPPCWFVRVQARLPHLHPGALRPGAGAAACSCHPDAAGIAAQLWQQRGPGGRWLAGECTTCSRSVLPRKYSPGAAS